MTSRYLGDRILTAMGKSASTAFTAFLVRIENALEAGHESPHELRARLSHGDSH